MMGKQLRLSAAAILATSVVVTALPGTIAEAATYKDVPKTKDYYNAVNELSKRGLIQGYADKTFKPYANMTRGQIATILTRMLDLEPSQSVKFSDLSTDHPFYDVASAVVAAGIMTTQSGGKFATKEYLTRYEYAEILTKAFNLKAGQIKLPFTDVPTKYQSAVQAVYDQGLMKGTSAKAFSGNSHVNRSQVALTLYRAIQMQEKGNSKVTTTSKFTISNVTTSYIFTDKGTVYQIPDELKTLFNSSNSSVLIDAEVEAQFVNGALQSINTLTLNVNNSAKTAMGTNGTTIASTNLLQDINRSSTIAATTPTTKVLNGNGGTYSFTIVVNGTNVQLQNMNVANVLVGKYAYGQFTLQNVNVKQKVEVEDGYSSAFTLHFNDSNVPYLTLNRDYTTIESTSPIPQLFLERYAYDVTNNSAIGQLQIVRGGYVTLKGTGTIDKLIATLETDLYLNNTGYIKYLQVDDKDTWVRLGSSASIGTLSIPPHADYQSILYYPWNVQSYVEKVNYPNSTLNLLSNTITKPTREQLAYQEAFNNVIKSYTSSITNKRMSISTSFNDIPASLKELSFDQRIYLSGAVPNITTIPVRIYRGGLIAYEGNVAISELLNGVSVQSLTGTALDLGDFTPNGSVAYHIEFDTDREFNIRSSVLVNGIVKNTTEQTINAGYNDRVAGLINNAFNQYEATAEGNTIKTTIGINTVDPIIEDIPVNPYIRLLSNIGDDEEIHLKIHQGTQEVFSGGMSGSLLKKGFILGPLPISTLKDLANKETPYTLTFDTKEELEFETGLYINNMRKGALKTNSINSGTTEAIENLAIKYNVSSPNSATAKIDIEQLEIPSLVEQHVLDYFLKLSDAKVMQKTWMRLNVKIGTNTYPIEVLQEDLEKGIHLVDYLTNNSNYSPTTLADLRDGESVEIEFLSAMSGTVELKPYINRSIRGTANTNSTATIEKVIDAQGSFTSVSSTDITDSSTVTAFTVDTSNNSIRYTSTLTNQANSKYKEQIPDVRLTVTNGLRDVKDNLSYSLNIFHGTQNVAKFKQVTAKQLRDGILISSLLDNATKEALEKYPTTDQWTIVVQDLEDPLDVNAAFIVADENGSNETVLASASNTVNKPLVNKWTSAISKFDIKRNANKVYVESKFTATSSTPEFDYLLDYVLLPSGTTATTNLNVQVGTVSYGEQETINYYGNSYTFTPEQLKNGVSSLNVLREFINKNGLGPTIMTINEIFSREENSTGELNWGYAFNATPPKMQADLYMGGYRVKTAKEVE